MGELVSNVHQTVSLNSQLLTIIPAGTTLPSDKGLRLRGMSDFSWIQFLICLVRFIL